MKIVRTLLTVAAIGCAASTYAADEAAPSLRPEQVIQSLWQPQEINVTYHGFTTAYDCRALEDRVKRILLAVGAHPNTQVVARGCDFNRISRTAFIRIQTATAVPVTPELLEELAKDQSKQELIKRVGGKNRRDMDEFPAAWQRVELSRNRRIGLSPGDCELMKLLRDDVFGKLAVKVVEDDVDCVPNQVSLITPKLTVEALMPAPTAEAKQ